MSDDNNDPDFSADPVFSDVRTIDVAYCNCPKCGKRNYVYLGDMSDITAPDREAVRCWNCKTVGWLGEESRDMAVDMGYESIEEAYVEDGTEKP